MDSKLTQTRRANLSKWIAVHGMPPKEKSYFHQLSSGECSFGEKAARRLERDYNMGELFLDTVDEAVAAAPAERTELTRVDQRELRLLTLFRESTERGKQMINVMAESSEKELPVAIRRHQG